jgi:hypothetical protein
VRVGIAGTEREALHQIDGDAVIECAVGSPPAGAPPVASDGGLIPAAFVVA